MKIAVATHPASRATAPFTGLLTAGARRGFARVGVALAAVAVLAWLAPLTAHAGFGAWTSGGPETGPVIALAIDPVTPTVIYGGAQFGGVFKSATGASFWTPINNGITSPQIHTLAVDPVNPAIVYAGTTIGGLFKTTSGGVSWTAINTGLPFPSPTDFIYTVAIDRTTPTTLYTGTRSGRIFKSINGGASWSPSFTTAAPIFGLVVDPLTPANVYAGTLGDGVFKSTNGGLSWAASSGGLTNLTIQALAVDRNAPATLYAGTFGDGVFKSTNSGASWSPSSSGLGDLSIEAIAVDPQESATLYAGTHTAGAFKSTNGGASWSPVNNGIPAASAVTVFAINPAAPATLYAGVYGRGVFKSTDGGASWNPRNAGLAAAFILAVTGDPQTPATLYAGAQSGGLFKSTNGGGIWRSSSSGITDQTVNAIAVNPQATATVYAGTSRSSVFVDLASAGTGAGGVFKSANAGATWSSSLVTPVAVQALAISPLVPSTIYAGTYGSGVFKSTDAGATWLPMNLGLSFLFVFSLVIDPSGSVYAGISDEGATFLGRVAKTTTGGLVWFDTALVAAPEAVVALALDPQQPLTLYAGTWGGGAFKTINGGASWVPINTGLFNQADSGRTVFSLAVDPQVPATVYAGSADNGVFKSTNGGETWAQSNAGLPADSLVHGLAINPAGTCVHAGTGGSVYDFANTVNNECPSPPSLVSSVLPTSRSVLVNVPATAFATIINPGVNLGTGKAGDKARDIVGTNVAGDNCGINQVSPGPNVFTFQQTNPATNQPVGDPNTTVAIPPGGAATWVMSLNHTAATCAREVRLDFKCTNTDGAETIVGVNTVLVSASDTPVPDMIALAATVDNDGIVKIPGTSGTGFFAVATSNVGVTGPIVVSADTGGATLPISLALCETNPVNGQCTSALGPTVTTTISNNATPTFAIFATASGVVPNDLANNRIFVRFKDVNPTTCDGVTAPVTRGATSVAVRTQ